MTTAIDKTQAPDRRTAAGLLQHSTNALKLVIPKHVNPDRLCRLALSSLRQNPKLAQCTPESFVTAVMNASMLGLEVNTPTGLAYLVPYKNQCQLIIGYKGFVHLARNAKSRVMGHAVYQGDVFEYEYGTHAFIKHKPCGETDERKLTHTYATCTDPQGGPMQFVVLTRNQIEQRRKRSLSKDNGPWRSDFESMAVKSAVRALSRWLPLSPELALATALDEAAERRGTQYGASDPRVLEALEASGVEVPQDDPEPEQLPEAKAAFDDEPEWNNAREPGMD